MSRRALQITTAVLAIATIALGGMSLLFGVNHPVYPADTIPELPVLDSNLRFFGGMGLGLGIILLWITPTIERHGTLFRAVWLCAFLGGAGRLVSLFVVGAPSAVIVSFSILEVAGAPLLVYWQYTVARDRQRKSGA